jgi:hypothetical protein
MLQTWTATIVKREITDTAYYSESGTFNRHAGTKYHLVTKEGLFIEFVQTLLVVTRQPADNREYYKSHGFPSPCKEGDEVILTGEILKNYGQKIIIDCFSMEEDPAKYPEAND